jgi:hypothetical protein
MFLTHNNIYDRDIISIAFVVIPEAQKLRAFSNHCALSLFRRDLGKIIKKSSSNHVFGAKKFSGGRFFR